MSIPGWKFVFGAMVSAGLVLGCSSQYDKSPRTGALQLAVAPSDTEEFDVTHIKFEVTGDNQTISQTVSVSEPVWTTVLAQGEYSVQATPQSASGGPSAVCHADSISVDINPGVTTKINMISRCNQNSQGGLLGVTVAFESVDNPTIDSLTIKPGFTVCPGRRVEATANTSSAVSEWQWSLERSPALADSKNYCLQGEDSALVFSSTTEGDYSIRVKVIDSDNQESSLQFPITVSSEACEPIIQCRFNQDCVCAPGPNEPEFARAVYIWESDSYELLRDDGARQSSLNFFAKQGVSTVYLYADQFGDENRIVEAPEQYRTAIQNFHDQGIKVCALLGSALLETPTYILPGNHDLAVAMLDRVITYNGNVAGTEQFDCVNLSILPHVLPAWQFNRSVLSIAYLDMLEALIERNRESDGGIEVGVSIPAWYSLPSELTVTWGGQIKPLSEHVQDISDMVTVLALRNFAMLGVDTVEDLANIDITSGPVLLDSDGDGLLDYIEAHVGTNPNKIDSDDDGLTDHQEVLPDLRGRRQVLMLRTDPNNPDTDGDGILDGHIDKDTDDPELPVDKDNDGLPDEAERRIGTKVDDADSDDDGWDDWTELVSGWDPLLDDPDPNSRIGFQRTVPDQDLDWLSDAWETCADERGGSFCIDPETGECATLANDDDTDDDGRSDGFERFNSFTNPCLQDTDGDGDPSSEEPKIRRNDTDEINIGSSPLYADSDDDGIPDIRETDTYGTNPELADSDGDGLTDVLEIRRHGTLPLVTDTDNDGVTDGDEVNNGTSPLTTGSGQNGLIFVAKPILDYGESIGKPVHVAVETLQQVSIPDGPSLSTVSFFEGTIATMEHVFDLVVAYYSGRSFFKGFAIHDFSGYMNLSEK